MDHWLAHFELYARDLKLVENDWPGRAMYFLVGKALESVLERRVMLQQAGTDLLADWPTFQNGMRNAFSPVSPEFAVRARLDKLKQTGTVSAYWEAFRGICARAGANPVQGAEAIHLFVKGLKDSVRLHVAIDPSTRLPYADLQALVKHALIVDQTMFGLRAKNREPAQATAGESASPAKGGRGKRRAQSPSRSGAPAKVRKAGGGQAVRSQGPPEVPGVCPELGQERWDKRLCLKCGEAGHGYSACPHSSPVIPSRFTGRNSAWVAKGKGKARETP